MNAEWMGERVAQVSLKRILANVIHDRDEVSWGPNATFRFPVHGGTGAIWQAVGEQLPKSHVRLQNGVTKVDLAKQKVVLQSGEEIEYDYLVNTMPLDHLCSEVVQPPIMAAEAKSLCFSSTHIVGLGFEGKVPEVMKTMAWMYFPEDDCPFYRVCIPSNFSPNMVPEPSKQWSILFEVSQSKHKPVNASTLIDEVVAGAIACSMITAETKIVSKYHRCFYHGYPTPYFGRNDVIIPLRKALEEKNIYSRGRFGAWKYEVGNQDHSFMQGLECVDHLLSKQSFPGVNPDFAQQHTINSADYVNNPANRSTTRYLGPKTK
eukprot:Platyproteum_vivax@DN4396_c0_g1_i1.p1